MNKKKITSILIFFIVVLITFNFNQVRSLLRANLPDNTKVFIKELFFGQQYMSEIQTYRLSNYNQKSLPETQFETINLKKINLDIKSTDRIHYNKAKGAQIKSKKFFLEFADKNLVVVGYDGKFNFVEDLNEPILKSIPSNLDKLDIYSVLDIAYIKKEIYVSLSSFRNKEANCTYFELLKAKFNTKELVFDKIYETNVCLENTLGGRIIGHNHNNIDGILLTTGASDKEKYLAQKDDSPYGKILFLSLDGKIKNIFSKGHRNPQGLLKYRDVILSTEHGPYGGDEINKIIFGKNYGFPISSYGDSYHFDEILHKRQDYTFEKNHIKNNFTEPIFSFVPAVGISEIINVPETFSKYWYNNFLITSLNGNSIYRVKFDDGFNKILFLEKIFIGERIRDIKFNKKLNSFVLALEESGSLGILSSPQS